MEREGEAERKRERVGEKEEWEMGNGQDIYMFIT